MLRITVPAYELWDEANGEFVYGKEQVLTLEHSLVSLSKWESRWRKPFLSQDIKTREETVDYIRCMTLTQNVDPIVYDGITDGIIREVNRYIEEPMTATWFSDESANKRSSSEVTAEIIYYSMIALNIPMECQKWHLNRLLTLIKVCNIKNSKPKKMSTKEIMDRNTALNEKRLKELNTRG